MVYIELVLWAFYDEKPKSATFYLTRDYFRDMTQPTLGIKVGFHWQVTHVESTNDVVYLHNIEL